MNLQELAQHCANQIRLQSKLGKSTPEVLLMIPGSPYRRTATSGRRLLCPGGPLGEIVSSVETHDNVMFDASQLLSWCDRKIAQQEASDV